jgi:hypothetical protein
MLTVLGKVLCLQLGSGFDPHSLPPLFNDNLQTRKSLANQFGFGRAICTTLE